MAHPRTEIRHAVIAALTGTTAAGARVYDTRIDPHRKGALPALSVYTLREESADDSDSAPRELERVVSVEVAGWVSASESDVLANAMDDLAWEIEAVMDASRYLGGKAADSTLDSTELEIRAEDGRSDPLIGIVTLTYSVGYRTSPAAAEDLDDFLTVDAQHRPAGTTADNQARDQFTVQEAPP